MQDGNCLSPVNIFTGVLNVQSYESILSLLKSLLVHGNDLLHLVNLVGAHHIQICGAMGSDLVVLCALVTVIHASKDGYSSASL